VVLLLDGSASMLADDVPIADATETRFERGRKIAVERLTRSRVAGRDQSLVVITDGESNTGIEPELAARYVREQGIRFYAIGVGGTEPMAVSFEGNPIGAEGD
jgi:Mg-chelatase subunit ChlD